MKISLDICINSINQRIIYKQKYVNQMIIDKLDVIYYFDKS
jgi:hypothetical protein